MECFAWQRLYAFRTAKQTNKTTINKKQTKKPTNQTMNSICSCLGKSGRARTGPRTHRADVFFLSPPPPPPPPPPFCCCCCFFCVLFCFWFVCLFVSCVAPKAHFEPLVLNLWLCALVDCFRLCSLVSPMLANLNCCLCNLSEASLCEDTLFEDNKRLQGAQTTKL